MDPRGARSLAGDVITPEGAPRIMPASFYEGTSQVERSILGRDHGLYSLPTEELVEWLKSAIGGRSAIEIGAGHGALANAVGIRATDNRMQELPEMIDHLKMGGNAPVPYGAHVEKLDAEAAVRKYQPQVVVACWVTHKYRPDRHASGGNVIGVTEEEIIANCEDYIFIGNHGPHEKKFIWDLPHEIFYPDWLYSRAASGKRDFIAVWRGAKHPANQK